MMVDLVTFFGFVVGGAPGQGENELMHVDVCGWSGVYVDVVVICTCLK